MHMSLLAEEFCPVSDALLGRLYRASPDGLSLLVKSVPPETRAALAFYCYRRAHLESIGLAIAATCDEWDLTNHAGRAGLELFAKSRAPCCAPAGEINTRKNVTLASGALWSPPSFEKE
jgi:hypothetical protein